MTRIAAASQQETRQRLVEAAARLFAEAGFERVTVRQICRAAGANVAAVNYHFGDKFGLYTAVIRSAIDDIRERRESVIRESDGARPEARLHAYIHAYIDRVLSKDPNAWIHRLMAREMAEPTPALDLLIEEAIKPRVEYLAGIVCELLKCRRHDARVPPIVASIHGQCLIYVPTPVSQRIGGYERTITRRDGRAIADHITAFSLAGIRALR